MLHEVHSDGPFDRRTERQTDPTDHKVMRLAPTDGCGREGNSTIWGSDGMDGMAVVLFFADLFFSGHKVTAENRVINFCLNSLSRHISVVSRGTNVYSGQKVAWLCGRETIPIRGGRWGVKR